MARRCSATHTRGMEYVFTKIIDLAPIALVSIPIVISTLVLVLLIGTGAVGRATLLLEDLKAGERREPSC